MKLYSIWQPLDSEDERTAAVFGFLRHAPAEYGLSPWLSEILGRRVSAKGLNAGDFWPTYRSHLPGRRSTCPELVFSAEDSDGPFHVVIEAKTGVGMHTEEQLAYEVVDTAHEEPASRIAVIAVGADLGTPGDRPRWQGAVDAALAEHGPAGTTAEVHYSSWAQLGDRIEAAASAVPEFASYSEDVLSQMRFRGMLGYKGAPVYDDLKGELTVVNAFELVNRAAVSARQFFRFLHDRPAFRSIDLEPYWGNFQMRRNGTSTALTQDEQWFEVSMFISAYRKPDWPEGAGAYGAFYFAGEGDEPLLQVGAFVTGGPELLAEYDYSDTVDDLDDVHLAKYQGPDLAIKGAGDSSEWLYDERPWKPGEPEADITWAIERLQAAASVFD